MVDLDLVRYFGSVLERLGVELLPPAVGLQAASTRSQMDTSNKLLCGKLYYY